MGAVSLALVVEVGELKHDAAITPIERGHRLVEDPPGLLAVQGDEDTRHRQRASELAVAYAERIRVEPSHRGAQPRCGIARAAIDTRRTCRAPAQVRLEVLLETCDLREQAVVG